MLLGLYRLLTDLGARPIETYLEKRLARGKEDPDRIGERRGMPSKPRPTGRLFWMHAASNGEAMSALPLATAILEAHQDTHLLLTTGTVTSARLVEPRLPDRAFHQFIPVDRRAWVRSFLNHWQPDAGIWVESEFWPNLITEMQQDGRPMALVNGRISEKSLSHWKWAPKTVRTLLSGFRICLAQTEVEATRLRSVGAENASCVGNLKHAAPTLDADEEALEALRTAIGGRPFWLAASTHPGEEAMVLDAHRSLIRKRPDLLTIIVPRHPVRGQQLFEELSASGIGVARRANGGALPEQEHGIYLADTLGELGLFYRLAETVLIGGTLMQGIGGHNPIEPSRLNCALLLGPDMANFEDMADTLLERGGARRTDGPVLARDVAAFMESPERRAKAAAASHAFADEGAAVPSRVIEKLRPILEEA